MSPDKHTDKPLDERHRADVLILGAGAAGLTAARELSRSCKVIVLEARDRVGGRIRSIAIDNSPMAIELGPEFIHGHAPQTFGLLRESGLVAYDLAEQHLESHHGVLRNVEQDWSDGLAVLEELDRAGDTDLSFRDFLDRFAPTLNDKARAYATGFVEGFNAARQSEISVQALRVAAEADEQIDGDRQYRLIGRYDQLPQALARAVAAPSRIDLETVVTHVRWKEREVTVRARTPAGDASYRAKMVIVALPLGVLQRGEPVFDPPLLVAAAFTEALAFGPVVKAMVHCRSAFWESLGDKPPSSPLTSASSGERSDKPPFLQDLSFVHDLTQPFPTWWTTLPLRTPLLTGWCGGSAVDRLPAGEAAIKRAALESLAAIFGVSEDALLTHIETITLQDWREDPFTHGAYSYVRVGGVPAVEELSRPIASTLLFAGEHTHVGLIGTVAGAIASGERAAAAARDLLKQ